MSTIMKVTPAVTTIQAQELSGFWGIVACAPMEMLLFAVSILAYFVLFMQRTPVNPKLKAKKKVVEDNFKEDDYPTDAIAKKNNVADPKECAKVEKAFEDAFESGDYRSVLRYWNTMKNFEKMPAVSLAQVVESMQRFKKDTPFILRELKVYVNKFASECDIADLNDLFESLAKRLDSELMEKIVETLPSMQLKMDVRCHEIFLNMYFTTRSFQEVKKLASQMQAEQAPFSPRSLVIVIKTALKMSDFNEAMQYFRSLKSTWTGSTSPSMAPTHVVSQLAELACKEHKLGEFLTELPGVALSEELINTMFSECLRQRDVTLTGAVEKLAREQGGQFTDATYSLLIKSVASDPVRVQEIFDEVVEKGVEVSPDFASSMLAFCTQTSNVQLAEKVYAYMKPKQLLALSAFIRFYADSEHHEKACDVYEQGLLPLMLAASEDGQRSLRLDARVERSLMNAALKCGRGHLAKDMLSSSPSDVAKHITMIRNCATEHNLKGAVTIFESLERSGVDMNSVIYNTVLDACVECRDLKAAETWMEQTKKAGMADVVSFNTLIKAHLQGGHFEKARGLMEEMKKEGFQPNRVTFNELINAMIGQGGACNRKQLWDIIDEMKTADAKPNQVTISILLKTLNGYSGQVEVKKTMDLIDTMDEPMDEVLLSSVVEACVRIGKPDLLASKLKQLHSSSIAISGSHTYGSLIKAYGKAQDINGIWRCWKEMRSRHIVPTSITLGCMVEAIVSNADTEGAYDLVHQIQDDEQCSGALNSIIYCSILKGFTRERKMDRALDVYQEINKRDIDLSIVMYNTLIDACARCGRMDHLSTILGDMKTHSIKPNVITYSTTLKGYCQNGDIQKAFLILEQMKQEANLKPDEIMYNSLLDGCAQNNLVDEGLRLLDEMQAEGVQPSNFTLSVLVKLMNRARRLDQAFSLVEQITKKYRFSPNVHVYTNLMQACVSNQQLPRGMKMLEQMLEDRVAPDSRTYSILVRGSISKGLYEQAVGLLKGALGLPGALPFLKQSNAVCWNLDSAVVNEALSSLADYGHAKDLAVPLLAEIKQDAPKVRVDAATQRKVMDPCAGSNSGGFQRQGKGKGKGSVHPWDRR